MRQQVILATPTSFVALLKAIAYGWQQARLAQNAAEVRRLALELYERLNVFVGHLGVMGKELAAGLKAYNRAVGSLERSVLPSARRFTELGIAPREPMGSLEPLEITIRESASGDTSKATAQSGEGEEF
mgnify:FL=1